MPRLTDQMINARIRAAMMPPIQPGMRQKLSPQTSTSLLQRAMQKRAAKPDIKMSPEQKTDLKAKALPTGREEM